jgi:hypothetical protein
MNASQAGTCALVDKAAVGVNDEASAEKQKTCGNRQQHADDEWNAHRKRRHANVGAGAKRVNRRIPACVGWEAQAACAPCHPYSAISAGTLAGPASGFSSISSISSVAPAISAAAAANT